MSWRPGEEVPSRHIRIQRWSAGRSILAYSQDNKRELAEDALLLIDNIVDQASDHHAALLRERLRLLEGEDRGPVRRGRIVGNAERFDAGRQAACVPGFRGAFGR
jgi:hypothetical protein